MFIVDFVLGLITSASLLEREVLLLRCDRRVILLKFFNICSNIIVETKQSHEPEIKSLSLFQPALSPLLVQHTVACL
jgi:hypothetical protein